MLPSTGISTPAAVSADGDAPLHDGSERVILALGAEEAGLDHDRERRDDHHYPHGNTHQRAVRGR